MPNTKTATIRYAPDASINDPTEIVAPARVYPNGFDVACGGCAVAVSPGMASLTNVPASAGTITITPRN